MTLDLGLAEKQQGGGGSLGSDSQGRGADRASSPFGLPRGDGCGRSEGFQRGHQ